MTFNDNADISRGRVSRRTKGGIAAGGGVGIVALAVFLIQQFTGVNVAPLADQILGGSGGSAESSAVSCELGSEANTDLDCRMQGAYASLDTYWESRVEGYRSPADFVLFEGSVSTGCGNATSAVGPFYCPPDESIYIDTSFFAELSSRYGASTGPLAQLYVVAHEWGHHIQNLIGQMDRIDNNQTGPTSDGVRLELQADCFAGAWVGAAERTTDANGVPYLVVTDADIRDALSAAEAVGDDSIQEAATGRVNPETWTHGASEQREKWFETGRTNGPQACDTFSISGSEL